MERSRQKSSWENNFGQYPMIFMLLWLVALMRLEAAPGPVLTLLPETPSSRRSSCAPGDVKLSGKQFCCNRCNPGYKMVEECQGPGMTTKCQKCEEGITYQDSANYSRNCRQCTICKENEEEVSRCTTTKNRVCKCKTGYYKHIIEDYESIEDYECRLKKKCGAGEREKESCKEDQDRQCDCKDDHYRVNSTTCKRCDGCREECSHLCTNQSTTDPHVTKVSEFPLLAVVVPVTVVATAVPMTVALVIYTVIKQRLKLEKKSQVNSDPDDSTLIPLSVTSSEALIPNTYEGSIADNQIAPLPTHIETQNECDCILQEVKANKFIYSVLEVVPVGRVTELVRLLGVKDQDIERARRDNSISCHEAHYHMLKLWSDRGTRGRSTTLPRDLLQELLETLRDMGLGGCAESLVDEYRLEQA